MRNDALYPAFVTMIFLAAASAGCGSGDDGLALPYMPNETMIIGPEGTDVEGTPSGDDCIQVVDGECVQPQDECGDGAYADVLLDSDGEVIETVCLPIEPDTVLVEVEDGVATVPDNEAVVDLGYGFDGDVRVEGTGGVLYGDSPDETVIDGNLELRGSETLVRGVTVTGDVDFKGNAAEFYYCVVHGDVVLTGNSNLVSNCVIFGSILGSGNEDELISNYVTGEIRVGGEARECRDNHRFEDADEDGVLDEEEIDEAEPIDCEKR